MHTEASPDPERGCPVWGPLALFSARHLAHSEVMDGPENTDGIEHLSTSQCWQVLREAAVGRVAVVRDGKPDIFPVNHVVDHGTVVYRTGTGTMFEATLRHDVAFEVDGFDDDAAWSVVLHGRASEQTQITALIDSFSLPVAPWQSGAKPHFVRIEASEVSGRRFRVAPRDGSADIPSESAPSAKASS